MILSITLGGPSVLTLAAFDFQTIVTLIGFVVAAAVAILNALQKKKYAGLVKGLWISLQDAAVYAKSKNGDGNSMAPNSGIFKLLEEGANNNDRLADYVHTAIAEWQRTHPSVPKRVGGNAAWNEAYEKVISQ